jgi:hypothetical protein
MSNNGKNKIGFFENRRLEKKFPIRWLSYKRRILIDVERLFREHRDDAEAILNDDYMNALSKTIIRIEDWILKLFSIQIAVTAFFVLGFLSESPSISLFGIALSGIAGLKEILLAIWFSVGLATSSLMSSKDMLTFVAKAIHDQQTRKHIAQFSLLAIPAPFNIYIYSTRAHDDWIFAAPATKLLTVLVATFFGVAYATFFLGSLALSVHLLQEVYVHPTLGRWSYVLLFYSCLTLTTGVLLVIRLNVPLPYRDKSELKRLVELEKIDPKAAAKLRSKIFSR